MVEVQAVIYKTLHVLRVCLWLKIAFFDKCINRQSCRCKVDFVAAVLSSVVASKLFSAKRVLPELANNDLHWHTCTLQQKY